ncbi:DUF2969 domain-containing protein [Enterococcus cecorum]|uniref:DUF2969 domain-containing protein n=1 Tax=Enterococcus cecorum TaxID=44008 RepID=UPI001FAD27D7|nr:DUF2969 domain-containing protein [Enterococcus cecorum]MCJ0545065.1 DUF2969 domain-containing protein [Enterococcus cecorum]
MLRKEGWTLKKNKDIQVQVVETTKQIDGTNYDVTQLAIGKKTIGEVLHYGPKAFVSFMNEEEIQTDRSLDAAIETILMRWNLQE